MKNRKDSFFGIHFDFHATPSVLKNSAVGRSLKEEDLIWICEEIKPDFLQTDCKGHPGNASYPSKLGNSISPIEKDPIAIWRKITNEYNIGLYLHYSGVMDANYISKNPDEGKLQADGTRDKERVRTCGKYNDELLIPQLKELAENYEVDGVWVDGDCWADMVDFDERTVKLFEETTKICLNGKIPVSKEDEYYEEYRDFCRQAFRDYIGHYTNEIHKEFPSFQVCSNWAYSDHMPEPVTTNVDFISGDLNPNDSFYSARFSGRTLAAQEMTWDLMAWSFRSRRMDGYNQQIPKNPIQIIQEAASTISLGGGFQVYITQYGDGGLKMHEVKKLKELSNFMHSRRDFCFRGKMVHQVGVLLSTYDRKLESDWLFSRNGTDKISGITNLLCDIGVPNEIVMEHTLEGKYSEFPVIIVPELYYGLEENTINNLIEYANNGGNLILIGKNTCDLFSKYNLGYKVGESIKRAFITYNDCFGASEDAIEINAENQKEFLYISNNPKTPKLPTGVVKKQGKGTLSLLGINIGRDYSEFSEFIHRDIMKELLSYVFLKPFVKIDKVDGLLEVSILNKDGKYFIQLVNSNGNHRNKNIATEDFILPCTNASISIRTKNKPSKLILQPEGKELSFDYNDGVSKLNIDKISMHEIIEIVE